MTIEKTGLSNESALQIIEYVLRHPAAHVIVATDEQVQPVPQYERPKEADITSPSDVTSKIAAIWMGVLEVKQVDNNDDFYDLGGDSLTAIQLVYKLKQALHIEISPDLLLSKSKFGDFCVAVESSMNH